MYRWHLRRIGGRGNLGWLRNAFKTQVQQIVRSDLLTVLVIDSSGPRYLEAVALDLLKNTLSRRNADAEVESAGGQGSSYSLWSGTAKT